MADVKIGAEVRSGDSKNYKHNLRDKGKIPAVVYGKGIDSQAVELNVKDLEAALRKKGRNALIDLVIEGGEKETKHVVIVKEIQKEPITGKILHVDLCKVSLKDKMHTAVSVTLKGEPMGLKNGGIIQTGPRTIEVECIPSKIPDTIAIDVSSLEIGDHLTVADIPESPDYKILTEPDTTLVTIIAPRAVEQPAEPVAETTGTAPAGQEAGPKTNEEA